MTPDERELIRSVKLALIKYLKSIDANVSSYESFSDRVAHNLYNQVQRKFKRIKQVEKELKQI